jgi:hypothetical protein
VYLITHGNGRIICHNYQACFVQKQRCSPNRVDSTLAQPSSCVDENGNLGATFVSHSDLKCLMQWHDSLQNDGDKSVLLA